MEAYTAFAKVYDSFMRNVPYEKWAAIADIIINKMGVSKPSRQSEDVYEQERNLVLDLGCGTGVFTRLMYDKGYDMIGVDISQEMLDEAYSKSTDEKYSDIIYICQDMCELDLYSTIGTVISTCDSINYLLEDDEIKACFAGVKKYLYPEGLFIFDFNTIHKYKDVIGERTIAENDEECSFIWDNFYNSDDDINEYDLTLFIRDDESGMYERATETHYQRGYSLEQIKAYIDEVGLEVIACIDESVTEEDNYIERVTRELDSGCDGKCINIGVSDESERVIMVVKKKDKNSKEA